MHVLFAGTRSIFSRRLLFLSIRQFLPSFRVPVWLFAFLQ